MIGEVVEFTRPFLERGLVAVYLHGSWAGGVTDTWSDVDVAGICESEEQRSELFRDWVTPLEERFEHWVDPVVAARGQLHEGGDWHMAFLRDSLLARAEVLLGEDLRGEVAPITEHLARLAALTVALTWLRRLYDLPRFYPLPESPEGRPVHPLDWFDRGNAAWQLATAVTRLVAAVVLLETGESPESREALGRAAERLRWAEAAAWLAEARAVRREMPRFGEVDTSAPALIRLTEAVSPLAARLFAAMRDRDFADPTFEGKGGGFHEADGTRKAEPPQPFVLSEEPEWPSPQPTERESADGNG